MDTITVKIPISKDRVRGIIAFIGDPDEQEQRILDAGLACDEVTIDIGSLPVDKRREIDIVLASLAILQFEQDYTSQHADTQT